MKMNMVTLIRRFTANTEGSNKSKDVCKEIELEEVCRETLLTYIVHNIKILSSLSTLPPPNDTLRPKLCTCQTQNNKRCVFKMFFKVWNPRMLVQQLRVMEET